MTEQKRKLLRARVALSFYEVYGRRPPEAELEERVNEAQLYYPAIIPDFFERQKQKREMKHLPIMEPWKTTARSHQQGKRSRRSKCIYMKPWPRC